MPPRYFLYSVAQYVHSRREERLNVGIVVYDREGGPILARFAPKTASHRIKLLFPEVDRSGIEHYLRDIQQAINTREEPLDPSAGNPLDIFASEWQNIIRFTPSRPFPSSSAREASVRLAQAYLAEPVSLQEERATRGIQRARRRTQEAISSVLQLPLGALGYSELVAYYPLWEQGKEYKYKIQFPFLLYNRHVIDALSFHSGGLNGAQKEADHFIQKRNTLAKINRDYVPYATVAIPQRFKDEGHALLAFIREEAELPRNSVVDADEAEIVVTEIKKAAA